MLDQIRDTLNLDALTVTGDTLGENLDATPTEIIDESVIRPASIRSRRAGARGACAATSADGAVMKFSAADPRLLQHAGRAIVFDDIHDMAARVDDPDLEVDADSVMVLKNAGPVGGPGMPEWGHLPIPAKLLKQGVTDVLRISDARMSGTSYGAVVLHVAPESAIGGPLRWFRTATGSASTSRRERSNCSSTTPSSAPPRGLDPRPRDERGYRHLHAEHVLQANEGCDLDFLRGRSAVVADAVTYL